MRSRSGFGKATPIVVAAAAVIAGGCGGGDDDSPDSDTLRTAFSANVSSPDPALFYENEGLSVTNGVYDSLIRYKANTERPELEPQLATDWEVSPDGLTYTFDLRDGVTFHDGTTMDSEAVKSSFERHSGVEGGPSYMLADVARYETPDPKTFVVVLKQPVQPFLDFVASPYGPKIMSPTLLEKEEKNGDLGQSYLKTHDAGSGPYEITTWEPGDYRLTKFDDYWGEPAHFQNVEISVTPNFTTQQLDLEQGNIDLMINGVLPRNIPQLEDKGLAVERFTAPIGTVLAVNPDLPPFDNPDVRAALQAAVDRETIAEEVYQNDYGELGNTIAPGVDLPEGTNSFDVEHDPSALESAVSSIPSGEREVSIAYAAQDSVGQQIADLVQSNLSGAGLETTARAYPLDQLFAWPVDPKGRANILIIQQNADTPNPQTWYSLYQADDGGLNWFSPTGCQEGTDLQLEGYRSTNDQEATELYAQADAAYAAPDCGAWIPLANVNSVYAARSDLTGFEHPFAFNTALNFAALQNK